MRKTLTVLALAHLAMSPVPSLACGMLIPRPIRPIYLPQPIPQDQGPLGTLEIRSLNVRSNIAGNVARTHVDQVFYNPGDRVLEGTYIFVVPKGASVSGFALHVDGKKVDGELLTSERARSVYESIVRQTKDPGLLEHLGQNVFSARIYPIPARGERRIEIDYQEVLSAEFGLTRWTFPSRLPTSAVARAGQMVVTIDLEATAPLKNVYCPSHEVATHRASDTRARVGFEGHAIDLDRDFSLYWAHSTGDVGLSLLCHRPDPGEPGYFMALVSPKVDLGPQDLVPKDIVLVLDTSGSMKQDGRIDQARRALKQCLQSLNRSDRFHLLTFATDVRPYNDGFTPASDPAIQTAVRWVETEVKAVGGTAIHDALAAALALEATSGRPKIVCFITDGEPTVGVTDPKEILAMVRKANGSRARIFTLGIGAQLNTLLVDQLADENGGTGEYVKAGEDIELKVSNLYRKLASPVLTDVTLDYGSVRVQELYPRQLGDLFAGTQLIVVGRYAAPGKTALALSGLRAGKPHTVSYDAVFPERIESNEMLPRIWATRKVGYLLDQIRLHGENPELKDEVVRLARRFGIVTPYTSYLVVEDAEEAMGAPGPANAADRLRRPPPIPPMRTLRRAAEKAWAPASAPTTRRDEVGRGAGGYGLGAPSPAPAFESHSGERAVSEAEALRSFKEARTVTEAAQRGAVRGVGTRTFTLVERRWVDDALGKVADPLTVRYGSEAYFQLIRRFKELAPCLALGPEVSVRFGGRAIVVSLTEGVEKIDEKTIEALSKAPR